jgi:hypothetical protein
MKRQRLAPLPLPHLAVHSEGAGAGSPCSSKQSSSCSCQSLFARSWRASFPNGERATGTPAKALRRPGGELDAGDDARWLGGDQHRRLGPTNVNACQNVPGEYWLCARLGRFGVSDGIRTRDVQIHSLALYQAELRSPPRPWLALNGLLTFVAPGSADCQPKALTIGPAFPCSLFLQTHSGANLTRTENPHCAVGVAIRCAGRLKCPAGHSAASLQRWDP